MRRGGEIRRFWREIRQGSVSISRPLAHSERSKHRILRSRRFRLRAGGGAGGADRMRIEHAAPGKEADAILGDYVLKNDKIWAVGLSC